MAANAGPNSTANTPGNRGLTATPGLPQFARRLATLGENIAFPDLTPAVIGRKSIETVQPIWADTDGRQSMYVLEEGLAYSFTFLPGGKRHIDDIFGPGAICNWPKLRSPDYQCNLMLKPNSSLALVDPARFGEILKSNVSFAAALRRLELARTLRNSQRIRALISLPAPHRLSIFLLDLREEYRLSGNEDDWLPLGFTQEEIADLAGMTEVHVNRTLAKMQEAGELTRRAGYFCLPNAEKLEAQLDYRRFTSGYGGDGHD